MTEKAVILVEPEIPENTGFIARLCSNFDFNLRIVSPEFNLSEARKTAKNCQEKLRGTKIFESVNEAIQDLDYVVGTKPGRGIGLKQFQPRENTSIMIGRESNGLKSEELELCDSVVHIETGKYESINQSHAAGILMHSMRSREEKDGLDQAQKEILQNKLPESVYEAVLESNPSREKAGRILSDIRNGANNE